MTTVYSRADPDLSTSFGSALEAGPGLAFGNQIWTGPYYYELPPGKYVATAWIRVVAHSEGTQLRVDITGHPIVVSTAIANPSAKGHDYTISITIGPSRTLESGYVVNQNDSPNTFDVNVTLEYNWSSGLVFDCAGWVYSSTATFYLYDLSLRQITA